MIVTLGLLAALALVGGLTVVALSRSGDTGSPTAGPSPGPSQRNGGAGPTEPPSVVPSTTPRPLPTRRPKAPPTNLQIVARNKLYTTGVLPASKCREPSPRPTSRAAVRAYYAQFLPCLDKVWRPTVLEAGMPFRSPRLVVYAGRSVPSPCGPMTGAHYCGSNETIYMNATEDIDNYRKASKVWTRTDMAFTIAHEYGHHVQRLTGILEASWDRQNALSNRDAALEENRRRELQASCLSAVYLGANKKYFPVSGTWYRWWRWKVYNHGDQWNPQRDHGDKKNHGWWSMRGFNTGNPYLCNTFLAKRHEVS
jgi:uncharacterized protein